MLVNIKNINKSYKNQSLKLDILKNIEFEIEEQDFIALMGPSGSGKSTLLNLIAGLDNQIMEVYFSQIMTYAK